MTNLRLSTMLVLLGGVLVCSSPAAAQTSQACASAKLKAHGKTASAIFNCHSKAAKLGIAVDAACVQKAEDKWNLPAKGAHQKAELKGGCALEGQNVVLEGRCTGDPSVVCDVALDCPGIGPCANRNDDTEAQGLYDLVVDENATVEKPDPLGVVDLAIAALVPNPAANACQSSKLKETGKLAAALLGCHSKAAKSNVPVDAACLAKAISKHTSAFAKADSKPPCDTTGDAAPVQGIVAPFVELSTIRIPRNDGCGSGVVLAGESCDDGNTVNTDNCPADCVIDQCTAPTGDDPWTVAFTSTKAVAAVTVFVDYPEGDISIAGSGGAISSPIDVIAGAPFTVAAFNDHDHALTGVLAEGTGGNFGLSGDLFTVHFETCSGGSVAAGDFTCTVLSAADATGKPLTGVTCSVHN